MANGRSRAAAERESAALAERLATPGGRRPARPGEGRSRTVGYRPGPAVALRRASPIRRAGAARVWPRALRGSLVGNGAGEWWGRISRRNGGNPRPGPDRPLVRGAPQPVGRGAFTASGTGRPASASRICSATSIETRFCASAVDAPRCGVRSAFGSAKSGEFLRRLLLEDVDPGARRGVPNGVLRQGPPRRRFRRARRSAGSSPASCSRARRHR